MCLLAARGVVWGAHWIKAPRAGTSGLVLVVLGLGIWHGIKHWPVLLRADNRLSYISVPEVVQRLQREVASAPTASHRLIVPLPCDLPSIFYMDRAGFRIPHNGIPQPGERLWLIARQAETPSAVLQDGLVQLPGWQDRVTTWQVVDRYQTLTLYSARVLTAPTTGSEE